MKNIITGVLVLAVLVGFGLYFTKTPQVIVGAGAGPVKTDQQYFLNGFSVGADTNTAITKRSCATATFDPGSLATSTISNVTSTDIALAGAVMGDLCSASLSSATSSAIGVRCDITGTATATLEIVNLGTTNAAIDISSGTGKVCYTH